jgi:peptidoglycan/LPS O-acetylase OafA/YrhL
VHEIATNYEAYTYAWIWLIGACASLVGTINDPNYRFSWRLLGAIGCGGFLATASCGILVASHTSGGAAGGYPSGSEIGIASMVGLLGKHSDQVLRWLTSRVSAGKITLPDEKKPE